MDKFIQVLEFIENTPKSWNEIIEYCKGIGLDPQHAWDVLTDKRNPLIIAQDVKADDGIETHSVTKFRPTFEGHKLVANKGSLPNQSVTYNISNSENVNAVSGNGNTSQNIGNRQVVQTLPYTGNENILIQFDRWVMEGIFGSLEHSINPVIIVVSILSLLTGSPLAYTAYNSFQEKTLFNFSPLIILDSIAFFLVIVFGWGLVLIARETICPNCKKKFAFTRKARVLENRIDLPEKEVRNYKNSYSCDFCGFTKTNVPEIVEIEKSSE
jgi:hypothetical protein